MLASYKDFWRRYVDFDGKSSRTDFWAPISLHIILVFAVAIIGLIAFVSGAFILSVCLSVLIGLFVLALILPTFAVTVRRFYDAGRRRMSAVILVVLSVIFGIFFDLLQINSLAMIVNIVVVICTILLIIETLLPSKQVDEAGLRWL